MTAIWKDCRASTAVEFSLLMPVLFMLLLGILEFGRALWMRQDMQFAVEEASRYGLAYDTASASTLVTYAQNRLLGAGSSVVVTATTNSTEIHISATADFATLVPGLLPSGTISLTAHSRLTR